MIAIIDYGMGNPASIRNMLGRMGVAAGLTKSPDEAISLSATHYILPGVGAYDEGMSRLTDTGWAHHLRTAVAPSNKPLLGICLGMQLLFESSAEGRLPGLALIPGDVIRFDFPKASIPDFRIPHMGWKEVVAHPPGAELFLDLTLGARFYFVHSYYCRCKSPSDVAAEAIYGHPFTCAARRNNLFGVQFHPEKSHRFGMRLLRNFVMTNA